MSRYPIALELASRNSRARRRLAPFQLTDLLALARRGVAEGWLTEAEQNAMAHRELTLLLDGGGDAVLWSVAGSPKAHEEGEAFFVRKAANEHRLRLECARLRSAQAQHRLAEDEARVRVADRVAKCVEMVIQGRGGETEHREPGGADLGEAVAGVHRQGKPEGHGGVSAHADLDERALAAWSDEGRSNPVEYPDDRWPEVRQPVREGPISYLKHSNCSPVGLDARREARPAARVLSPPAGGGATPSEPRP